MVTARNVSKPSARSARRTTAPFILACSSARAFAVRIWRQLKAHLPKGFREEAIPGTPYLPTNLSVRVNAIPRRKNAGDAMIRQRRPVFDPPTSISNAGSMRWVKP